jgi:hypothetical protein
MVYVLSFLIRMPQNPGLAIISSVTRKCFQNCSIISRIIFPRNSFRTKSVRFSFSALFCTEYNMYVCRSSRHSLDLKNWQCFNFPSLLFICTYNSLLLLLNYFLVSLKFSPCVNKLSHCVTKISPCVTKLSPCVTKILAFVTAIFVLCY